ncbi:MAG: hypothetical protein NTU95_11670 [Methanothrix sp.]|nr:hypothetical protein [Methanothrix sp.]
MKWIVSISILCCLAWIGAASGAETSANQTGAAEAILNETSTHIFLQEGTNGSFVKDVSGNYTLTITGVIPYTVYFSDRPARDAGFAEMKQFLDGFSFDPNNPPNAAVMIEEGNEENDMVVVELTSPQYDEISHKLTYTAKRLDDYAFKSEWPKDLLSGADNAIPETFGKVLLVIDDCPCLPALDYCKSSWQNSCWKGFWKSCVKCGGCC